MTDSPKFTFELYRGDAQRAVDLLLPLCAEVFPGFDPEYLASRFPRVCGPQLWLARQSERIVGFKLGYRRSKDGFYSWLGGVHPSVRRAGVAAELIQRQHAHAASAGHRFIETRTRAVNNEMLILNLRNGFHVVGFEVDSGGISVVTLRKPLGHGSVP